MSPCLSSVYFFLLIAGLFQIVCSQGCEDDFEDGVDPTTASFVGYPGRSCGTGTDTTCYTAASGREKRSDFFEFPYGDTLRCEAGYCAEIDGGLGALCDNGASCRPGYTVCMPAEDGRERCMGIGKIGQELCFSEDTVSRFRIFVFGCSVENECRQGESRCYSREGLSSGAECRINPDFCAAGLECFDDSNGGESRCGTLVQAGSPCGEGTNNFCDAPGVQAVPTCRDGICRIGFGHSCDNGEVCDDGLTCVEFNTTVLNSPAIPPRKVCSDLNGDVGENCDYSFQLDVQDRFQLRTCREGLVCKSRPPRPQCTKFCPLQWSCEFP